MLVEFSVKNFLSIRERQTFSMVAAPRDEHRATHVIKPSAPATPDLLSSAVIYGPNAAGKSNLILALSFIKELVVGSAQKSQAGDEIDVRPFLMDDGTAADLPTEFEVIFIEEGVRYQYGVTLNRQRILTEWLIAYPKGSPQLWFERGTAATEGWKFGPSFKGQRKLWQNATRDNALFLSTAVQLKSEQLRPVFNWFQWRLRAIYPQARIAPGFTLQQCERDQSMRAKIVAFLKAADLGISDINVVRRKFDRSQLPDDMPQPLQQAILKDMENRELADVYMLHKTSQGRSVELNVEEESGGTQQLFGLAGPWLDVLENGWILVIDELDTSLHPTLMRKLVGMFNDPEVNKTNAQLIFSTHDVSILHREIFRRDQVWFVEKDRELRSHFYPLTDFSPRKDESFGRGYLQGRYGALPFVGDWGI